jgi:predicted acylesterase/phospholipase RssA
MKGWTDRGETEPTRPEFRVVTGTSTGSLIATFAFLGSGYDDTLRDAYLGIRGDRDVFESRWFTGLLFGDALSSTKPLRRRLESFITPEILTAVAQEGARGRRLFVGAVDLEHGTFKPWDLTAIASRGGVEARQRYINALMASTAIPVLFPPVEIDGVTYVDGGARRNIFLEIITSEARRFLTLEASAPSQATVYCLVNGTLDVGARRVRRKVLDIAKRSVDILLDESTDGNLLRVYLQAQQEGLGFRMASIPRSVCHAAESEENQFDPELMECLYDEGLRYARDEAAPWLSKPPLNTLGP